MRPGIVVIAIAAPAAGSAFAHAHHWHPPPIAPAAVDEGPGADRGALKRVGWLLDGWFFQHDRSRQAIRLRPRWYHTCSVSFASGFSPDWFGGLHGQDDGEWTAELGQGRREIARQENG
jgi:hypothetical protein